MTGTPRVRPFGDAAVLLDLDRPAGVAAARAARALAAAVEALRVADPRFGVAVAAAASVLVPFEPRALSAAEATMILEPLLERAAEDPARGLGTPREHTIRVRYGGSDGPDLDDVAATTGRSAAEVVALHAAPAYEVLFLGFAPGFAYLGEVPEPLRLPRLATPRPRVPAGSVAIADAMTAVYPHASAGGWRLLGRTDDPLFDPAATPPARLRAGDRVRFEPA